MFLGVRNPTMPGYRPLEVTSTSCVVCFFCVSFFFSHRIFGQCKKENRCSTFGCLYSDALFCCAGLVALAGGVSVGDRIVAVNGTLVEEAE